MERAHEAPSLARVGLVGVLPQLQAVPQHHVQDENQDLAAKRKECVGGPVVVVDKFRFVGTAVHAKTIIVNEAFEMWCF